MDTASIEDAKMGKFGFDLIADTTAHTGKWWKIVFLEDTAFTLGTAASSTADISGETFPKLSEVVGEFTAITLASGLVLAYKRPN